MKNTEILERQIDSISELMQRVGFSDRAVAVAALAAVSGGRYLQKLHGANSEVLKTVYKAKEGSTPVTVADYFSEKAVLDIISTVYPLNGIYAEESGISKRDSEYTWYIDPLDGTAAFLRQHKDSTVGMVLYKGSEAQIATICQPFTKELHVAEREKGAYLFPLTEKGRLRLTSFPQKMVVSDKTLLDKGVVIYMDPNWNMKALAHKLKFMESLVKAYRGGNIQIRTPGSNIYLEAQVAAGFGEAALTDFVGGPFDIMVGALIIQESRRDNGEGGKYTDIYGDPVSEKTQVAIGSNGLIHDQMLEILQSSYEGYQGFK